MQLQGGSSNLQFEVYGDALDDDGVPRPTLLSSNVDAPSQGATSD